MYVRISKWYTVYVHIQPYTNTIYNTTLYNSFSIPRWRGGGVHLILF